MSILYKMRSEESYFESKLHLKSQSIKDATRYSINCFEKFCKDRYDNSTEELIEELNALTKEKKEEAALEILEEFVNYISASIQASSVRTVFARLKPYLAYRTHTKIHSEDVKANISFRPVGKNKRYGLTSDDLKKILEHSSVKKKTLYLALASSGLRLRELLQCRKRDFDTSTQRIEIRLPPSYTKTKQERISFISSEAAEYVKPLLAKLKDDDLVFAKNPDPKKAELVEEVLFNRVRKKAGLGAKYENGTSKITIHSFRSYFITKCEKIHEGLGHALAGHDRYMKEYERFSDQELLEFYLKAEPELIISDEERQGLKIDNLEKIKENLEKKEREADFYKENMNKIIEEKVHQYNQEFIQNLEKMYDEQNLESKKRLDAMDRAFEKKLAEIDRN